MKKVGLLLVASWLLSSCSSSYTSNGEQHYKQSRNGAYLVVPPPLSSANISHFYDLPPQDQNPRVSIVPPAV